MKEISEILTVLDVPLIKTVAYLMKLEDKLEFTEILNLPAVLNPIKEGTAMLSKKTTLTESTCLSILEDISTISELSLPKTVPHYIKLKDKLELTHSNVSLIKPNKEGTAAVLPKA